MNFLLEIFQYFFFKMYEGFCSFLLLAKLVLVFVAFKEYVHLTNLSCLWVESCT